MDLAPNYAGTMMGITNTIGNFAGFVAPYITGLIIDGQVRNLFKEKTKISARNLMLCYFNFLSSANTGSMANSISHFIRDICGIQYTLCTFWIC